MALTQPGPNSQADVFLVGLIQLPVVPDQLPFLIGQDIRPAAGYQVFCRGLKQSRNFEPFFEVRVGFPGQPFSECSKGNPDF
jgi:hypothetical protein